MGNPKERETTKAPAKSSRKVGPAAGARSKTASQSREKTGAKPPRGVRFGEGQKGNPGGRPKLPEELKLAFRRAAPDALAVLERVMRSSKARPGDRIRAAEVILNRGYGTPTQSVELTGKDGGPIESMTYEQAKARLAELRAKQDA
jgi:hypothetical protein